MKDEKEYNFKNRAKEMMIDGEDWDKIRKETKLKRKRSKKNTKRNK